MSSEDEICRFCRRPKNWDRLWRRIKNERLQEDSRWRLLRIVDELGDAAKYLTYHQFYLTAGNAEEFRIAISDVLAMTYMLILQQDWGIPIIEELAFARLKGAIDSERLKSK